MPGGRLRRRIKTPRRPFSWTLGRSLFRAEAMPIAIIRIAGKCRAGRLRPAVLPQTARRVVAPYGAPLSAILDSAIDTSILTSLFRLVLPNAICVKISKASSYPIQTCNCSIKSNFFDWHIHNKIFTIAIVKINNAPTLHTTITFSACLFPLTSIYILPENEAQEMAINNNNIESFSISPSLLPIC